MIPPRQTYLNMDKFSHQSKQSVIFFLIPTFFDIFIFIIYSFALFLWDKFIYFVEQTTLYKLNFYTLSLKKSPKFLFLSAFNCYLVNFLTNILPIQTFFANLFKEKVSNLGDLII